jgi:hypothetical protein
MKKTLKTEDWARIHKSFAKRDEMHPNYMKNLDIADAHLGMKHPRNFITIESINNQIDNQNVGERVIFFNYNTPDGTPVIETCEIIEE